MDSHDSKRIPLSLIYAGLVLLFGWTLLYRVPMTVTTLSVLTDAHRVPAAVLVTGWPDGEIEWTSRDIAKISDPPIRRGDRLVAIDGSPKSTPTDVARTIAAAGVGGHLSVEFARKTGGAETKSIVSQVTVRSAADGEHFDSLRVVVAILGIVMPWISLAVGFWVAAVRPRDPIAWLVLFMLLGFTQIAGVLAAPALLWPDALRIPGLIYGQFFGSTWPISFALFGVYFAERLPWEKRHGWIKWTLLGPMGLFALGGVIVQAAEAFDLRALAPASRAFLKTAPIVMPVAICVVSFFFIVMGWKSGVTSSSDARRRIRLLYWGATISLAPLLVVGIVSVITGQAVEAIPIPFLIAALMFLPIFPLTLAYVIVVDKAMDVRVAIRQGIRYAMTRGTIRVFVVLLIGAAIWNAWNLVNDPGANRPRKLQAIFFTMAAAVVVPRAAQKAQGWADRKFFREAYDAELMLTNLSEEVRMIGETGPLLDTVLDRIATTLHVDRLVVFLLQGDRFVPAGSRGFDPPPTIAFPATADALRRLAESGRPLRIRHHDDVDSPLRREAISEDNRSRLSQVDAEILLPLLGKKELLGAITLGPKKSEEPYSPSDAKLLGLVATQTGLALENSRLAATIAREIAHRERMSREIEIARDVQQKLFPQRLPEVSGFDFAGSCRPAQGVGGDYYDFLTLPGGRLGIALGDVAGKGIPAALLMASLQASLRGQRLSGPSDLAQLMTNLNYLIYEASPDNRYATFFYGEIDPVTKRLDFVNAGHNAPMLFRAGGSLERLAASGPVVGLVDGGSFEQKSVALRPGDLLLVFSDGISEAMNHDEEEWGETRLAAAARAAADCEARVLIERLFAAADGFAAGAVQHDDMTVVAVRVAAE